MAHTLLGAQGICADGWRTDGEIGCGGLHRISHCLRILDGHADVQGDDRGSNATAPDKSRLILIRKKQPGVVNDPMTIAGNYACLDDTNRWVSLHLHMLMLERMALDIRSLQKGVRMAYRWYCQLMRKALCTQYGLNFPEK